MSKPKCGFSKSNFFVFELFQQNKNLYNTAEYKSKFSLLCFGFDISQSGKLCSRDKRNCVILETEISFTTFQFGSGRFTQSNRNINFYDQILFQTLTKKVAFIQPIQNRNFPDHILFQTLTRVVRFIQPISQFKTEMCMSTSQFRQ